MLSAVVGFFFRTGANYLYYFAGGDVKDDSINNYLILIIF